MSEQVSSVFRKGRDEGNTGNWRCRLLTTDLWGSRREGPGDWPLIVELQGVLTIQWPCQLADHLQRLLTLIQPQHPHMGHKPSHSTHCQTAHLSLDIICDFLREGKTVTGATISPPLAIPIPILWEQLSATSGILGHIPHLFLPQVWFSLSYLCLGRKEWLRWWL